MRKPTAEQPITALRAALASPWPLLREAAASLIREALAAPTVGEAADRLGVQRRALERLRADFPKVFADPKKK
jgi:hypothetical protein